MISVQDSRLFFNLLHYQLFNEFTVNELAFYINGYRAKDLFEKINEPWIHEFIIFINLKTAKMFLDINYVSPQGYNYIITKFQKSNEEGLKLFYEIFYEFCALNIPDFKTNTSKYLERATKKLKDFD